MEVGCCTYTGAAKLGGGGFSIFKGFDKNGNPIYANNETPVRNEREQADYIDDQIRIIRQSKVWGVFIFEFSFPISPFRQIGFDADLTSYAIVASFPPESHQSKLIPSWVPKEAFYRLGKIYRNIEVSCVK